MPAGITDFHLPGASAKAQPLNRSTAQQYSTMLDKLTSTKRHHDKGHLKSLQT